MPPSLSAISGGGLCSTARCAEKGRRGISKRTRVSMESAVAPFCSAETHAQPSDLHRRCKGDGPEAGLGGRERASRFPSPGPGCGQGRGCGHTHEMCQADLPTGRVNSESLSPFFFSFSSKLLFPRKMFNGSRKISKENFPMGKIH
jgi:hypothetical protein